jgi:hypothetical protein
VSGLHADMDVGVWGMYTPPPRSSIPPAKTGWGVWQFFPRSKKLSEKPAIFFFRSPQAKLLGVCGYIPPAVGHYPSPPTEKTCPCLLHAQHTTAIFNNSGRQRGTNRVHKQSHDYSLQSSRFLSNRRTNNSASTGEQNEQSCGTKVYHRVIAAHALFMSLMAPRIAHSSVAQSQTCAWGVLKKKIKKIIDLARSRTVDLLIRSLTCWQRATFLPRAHLCSEPIEKQHEQS